jgi:hypothetical protein
LQKPEPARTNQTTAPASHPEKNDFAVHDFVSILHPRNIPEALTAVQAKGLGVSVHFLSFFRKFFV